MLIIKKMFVKNFMSVGNSPIVIDFDEHERTIVTGENGSGKSTLFLESISYALYGKPFRKLKMGQLINTINNKNCIVELEFVKNNINFKVRRGQKSALFEIFKNDLLIDQPSSASEYQDILDQIIGIELNTFKQIVAIGTAGYLPFMQLPSHKRRSMIEDLISIDIFSIVNDFNKADIRELKTKSFAIDTKITSTKREYGLHKKYQSEQDQITSQQVLQHNDTIEENQTIIIMNEEKCKLNESKINHLLPIANKLNDLSAEISRLKNDLVELKTTKTQITNKKTLMDENSQCPSCDQQITTTLKNTQYPIMKKEINEIMDKAKDISVVIKSKNDEKFTSMNAQSDIDNLNNEVLLSNQTILNCTKTIKSTKMLITELKTPKVDVSSELIRLGQEIVSLVGDKTENSDNIHARDIIKNMIGDSGVKKFIIAQYIPLLNGYINKYLEALGANYVFILYEEFNETIKSRGRDTFSYNSFSQGERGRIDLSIILAFRKLVEARSNSDAVMNILILDELLDSSLDAEGTDHVNDLLMEISKENGGTKLYVISHNAANINSEIWTDCIRLNKIGNFTQIETSTL